MLRILRDTLPAGKIERVNQGAFIPLRISQIKNHVTHGFSTQAETTHLLDAGIRGFCSLFRYLYLVLPLAIRTSYCGKFVDSAQRRLIKGGHEFCSYTPHIDPRALFLEAGNDVLIEVV